MGSVPVRRSWDGHPSCPARIEAAFPTLHDVFVAKAASDHRQAPVTSTPWMRSQSPIPTSQASGRCWLPLRSRWLRMSSSPLRFTQHCFAQPCGWRSQLSSHGRSPGFLPDWASRQAVTSRRRLDILEVPRLGQARRSSGLPTPDGVARDRAGIPVRRLEATLATVHHGAGRRLQWWQCTAIASLATTKVATTPWSFRFSDHTLRPASPLSPCHGISPGRRGGGLTMTAISAPDTPRYSLASRGSTASAIVPGAGTSADRTLVLKRRDEPVARRPRVAAFDAGPR